MANDDQDVGDVDPSAALTITVPPLNPATCLARPVAVKVSIPLKTLFRYPTDATVDPPSEGMNRFWRGGIQNLDKEMEAYELLGSVDEENTDEISETPIIPVYIQTMSTILILRRVLPHRLAAPKCRNFPQTLTHHDLSQSKSGRATAG